MPKADLVAANGARIPAIGLGTWSLTGEEGQAAIAAALECGYRHLDTAAFYGNEVEVGRALAASGVKRDQVWLTTKVWHTDLAREAFLGSAQASLERLAVEQVDLLLIHWPSTTGVALAETIEALNEAKARGFTRHVGVSNFPSAMLAEAARLSAAPLVANQCEHHPFLDQSKVIAACRAIGAAFVSYTPLGRGGALFEAAPIVAAAQRHGRTPAQIVLRWHMQKGVVAIPRSRSPKRIAANLDVFGFALGDDEMAAISALARADGRVVNPATAPRWDG